MRALLLLLTVALQTTVAYAQSVPDRYELLRRFNPEPAWYLDHTDGYAHFRIPYASLVFQKASDSEWKVDVEITLDYFPDGVRGGRRDEPPAALTRVTWTGSRSATAFETTQSRDEAVEAVLKVELPAGRYRVVPRVTVNGSTWNRPLRPTLPSDRSAATRRPEAAGGPNGLPVELKAAGAAFVRPAADTSGTRLANRFDHARFGQPGAVLVVSDRTIRSLTISALADTSDRHAVEVPANARLGGLAGWQGDAEGVALAVGQPADGRAVWLVRIPQERLRDRTYRIVASDGDSVVAMGTIRPWWTGMPSALLNLDTAVDLMRLILSEDDHRAMKSGSPAEKERKFRAWWDARDPSPDTALNELMAEFYQRVDIAQDRFSSPSRPGYESPMGRLFIRAGEPRSIERRFPPEGGSIEVWTYPDRRYIFRSTSGFGDFELVRE